MAIEQAVVQFSVWAESVMEAYGYPGIFLVSFVGSLSVIFPVPAFAFIFALGSVLNPWLVGLSAGVGAGLGEIGGYAVGRGGRKFTERKYAKQLERVKSWSARRGMFLVTVVFNATPLPADVIGLFAGVAHYSLKRFLLASVIGKIIQSTLLALGGYYSYEAIKIIVGL